MPRRRRRRLTPDTDVQHRPVETERDARCDHRARCAGRTPLGAEHAGQRDEHRGFDAVRDAYDSSLRFTLRHRFSALLVFLAICVATVRFQMSV